MKGISKINLIPLYYFYFCMIYYIITQVYYTILNLQCQQENKNKFYKYLIIKNKKGSKTNGRDIKL
ncbi:hypothetical protein SAMN02745248_00596 [Hathewaya proteolytica DSM 3090]|uniref:Uncharacterized protein n=1 Tax=Hathewaya proteolytica DSM 3090 TaxID=1121331 RepID=A0A1M6L2K0_9CLOT|nr:hypothetical protein SAMN02745248_00596 [Hathewaya proteolytica DSM 3090]